MTRKHILILVLVVGLVLGGGHSTSAQVVAPRPVIDLANLAQNIAQWVQLVLTVANQVLELTPVDDIILSAEFLDTLDTLSIIITEAVGLSYDISSLNTQIAILFDLDTAPNNLTALKQRLAQIRRLAWQGHVTALRGPKRSSVSRSVRSSICGTWSVPLGALLGICRPISTLRSFRGPSPSCWPRFRCRRRRMTVRGRSSILAS